MAKINVYLDYGRTFFPSNVTELMALSNKRKVFRFVYHATEKGPNVYYMGICNDFTRDDCKAQIRDAFKAYGDEAVILPSLEGVR